MLEHTFIHVQKIGPKTERKLWERGIQTWHQFLKQGRTVFSPERDEMVRQELEASIAHLSDIRFFQDRLPSSEIWRVFDAFKDMAVYLDIETSGGYQGVDEITGDEIAARTGMHLNSVRKTLYKLYKHSLIGLRRSRDKETGWFVFHWRLQPDQEHCRARRR